jgi:hypothetical protein
MDHKLNFLYSCCGGEPPRWYFSRPLIDFSLADHSSYCQCGKGQEHERATSYWTLAIGMSDIQSTSRRSCACVRVEGRGGAVRG